MENNLKNYIYITKSLCYIPETNTVLYINYTSIKRRVFLKCKTKQKNPQKPKFS